MEDLSLHILDIAENAVRAMARKVVIEILEDEVDDKLTVCIQDDGQGMDEKTAKQCLDPFFTTKDSKKVGLGLSLLCQSAQEADGCLIIDSAKGKGTKVTAIFKLSHPDTRPLGDIMQTMAVLITGNPSVRFIYDYKKGENKVYFDSGE